MDGADFKMEKLFFTAGQSIYKVTNQNGSWLLQEKETPHEFRCLAADPTRHGRLYGGSFDNGLWITDDFGDSWRPAGKIGRASCRERVRGTGRYSGWKK